MNRNKHKYDTWLHIGTPKTGTSSIQATLYNNRKILLDHGFYYPDFKDNQHVPLARKLAMQAGSPVPFPLNGKLPKHINVLDLLKKNTIKAHTIILSSENFFQRPGCLPGYNLMPEDKSIYYIDRTIKNIFEYLQGTNIKLLIWLRPQCDLAESLYKETVRSSLYDKKFEFFIEHNFGFNYYKIIKLWSNYIDRDNIFCFSFDEIQKYNLNIVNKFFEVINFSNENIKFYNKNILSKYNRYFFELKIAANRCLNDLSRTDKITDITNKNIIDYINFISHNSPNEPTVFWNKSERVKFMQRYLQSNNFLINEFNCNNLNSLIELDNLLKSNHELSCNIFDNQVYRQIFERFFSLYFNKN